jgi:hypothetical protein
MRNKFIKYILIFPLLSSLLFLVSCERRGVEEPLPTGPSTTVKILTITANPNTLLAGYTRQISRITVTFKYYDGTPIPNKKLFFEIRDASRIKVPIGYFEGKKRTIVRRTNEQGKVKVKYYGPLVSECNLHVVVYIWVYVAEKGEEFIRDYAPIYIIPIHY